MMSKTWNYDRAKKRIETRLAEGADPEIIDYTREMSLQDIPANKAYRVDAVHLYADILNIDDMLNGTDEEGVTCHRRTLRFLNQHYRAVHRILAACDGKRVDFHNQRLHSIFAKPYNSQEGAEANRVRRAVAVGYLIIEVLKETGSHDEHIPDAKVRIGIDTGSALAVNNGRRGGKEPLFLGRPANKAAKRAAGGKKSGIYLTNEARLAIGLPEVQDSELDKTPLTKPEIETCQVAADLPVDKAQIVAEWKADMQANPIGAFEFYRHTPPLRTMQIENLTPADSRRQEAVSIYADLDGFTNYVDRNIFDRPEDVVVALHVIRAEMDSVLTVDFEGRKIRFIGDCIHGLLAEGTAHATWIEETITSAVLCGGAIRSSFDLSLKMLEDRGIDTLGLGLAIGFEFGPMTVSRLGMKGDRVRCSISRGVIQSEIEQSRCGAYDTAIGPVAFDAATDAVRTLFGPDRKKQDLHFDMALDSLALDNDTTAKSSMQAGYQMTAPAIAKVVERTSRPHCEK